MQQLEVSQVTLAARHLAALRELLARHVPGAEVWAFGSRVGGPSHEGSDLDLVLRNAADPSLPVAGWARLVEALQASALPMGVDLHDWSQLPASFRAEIERRHAVIAVGLGCEF